MDKKSFSLQVVESRHGWIFFTIFVFTLTRLAVFIFSYLAEIVLPSHPDPGFIWHIAPNNIFIDVMARYDSGFYITIVKNGYSWNPNGMSNLAFFPLYPLFIRLLNPQTELQIVKVGILWSHIFFLAGLLLLYKLVILEWDDHASARRTVFYMAIAPASLYFSAVYTESLFLFLSVGFFYAIRREYWNWAVLMAMLMGVARMQGILAPPILLLAWIYAQGWNMRGIFSAQVWQSLWVGLRSHWGQFLLLLLSPSLLISHYLFLYINFGDPLIFIKASITGWKHEIQRPWNVLWESISYLYQSDLLAGKVNVNALLETVMILFAIFTIFFIWKKLGTIYGMFTLASVLLPITSNTWGFVRYEMVIFPITMMLGFWGKSENIDRAIIVVSLLTQALGMSMFANGFFFM